MTFARSEHNQTRIASLSVACLLWVALVLILDHFWVFKHLAGLGKCLEVEFALKIPAASITLPPLSVVIFVGIPLLALLLFLIPWRTLRNRGSWYAALNKWCQPLFWFLIAIVLTVLGQTIFLMLKDHLPKGLVDLSEAWTLDITIKSWDQAYATFNETLAAIVGLMIGAYLFVDKGLRRAIE